MVSRKDLGLLTLQKGPCTELVRTSYFQNVLSHILQNLRQRNVGRDPMGWMYFPWFKKYLIFSARGVNPG